MDRQTDEKPAETQQSSAENGAENGAHKKKGFFKKSSAAPVHDGVNVAPATEMGEKKRLFGRKKTEHHATENAEGKKEQMVMVNGRPISRKENTIDIVKKWALMLIGSLMMACSVSFFQRPNRFTMGGIASVSILLERCLDNVLPLTQGQYSIIINVFLLVIGLIFLGKRCTVLTIVCTLVYSGGQAVFEIFYPKDRPPITNDPFLELCYAVLLLGIGSAIIFNMGASSGGTDIIALIIKKYTKINIGVALMIVDYVIIGISYFVFKDWTLVLYSSLGLFVKSFLLDGIIENIGKNRYVTIITEHPDKISQYILQVIRHGYTMYDAQGGYTGAPRKVLITVCRKGEALRLKSKVKEADPEAFVIITDTKEILGRGFSSI